MTPYLILAPLMSEQLWKWNPELCNFQTQPFLQRTKNCVKQSPTCMSIFLEWGIQINTKEISKSERISPVHLHGIDSGFLLMRQYQPSLTFLPPANEIWGKVMFLHLCAILFTGGGVLGFCPGGSLSLFKGVCPGGSFWGRAVRETSPGQRPPPYGNELAVRILLECILVSFVSKINTLHKFPK